MTADPLLIVITIAYYLILPLGIIWAIMVIIKKKEYIKGTSIFSEGREDRSSSIMKEELSSIKKINLFLVIFLLISVPLINLTSMELMDRHIQVDRSPGMGPGGGVIYNPVPIWGKLGPSYNTEDVLTEMRENPRRWHLDDIKEEVDFEELDNIPGWLTVYYQDKPYWDYIILTYSYLSPLPISRVYGFRIIEGEAFLRHEETIVFPMNPGRADPF